MVVCWRGYGIYPQVTSQYHAHTKPKDNRIFPVALFKPQSFFQTWSRHKVTRSYRIIRGSGRPDCHCDVITNVPTSRYLTLMASNASYVSTRLRLLSILKEGSLLSMVVYRTILRSFQWYCLNRDWVNVFPFKNCITRNQQITIVSDLGLWQSNIWWEFRAISIIKEINHIRVFVCKYNVLFHTSLQWIRQAEQTHNRQPMSHLFRWAMSGFGRKLTAL